MIEKLLIALNEVNADRVATRAEIDALKSALAEALDNWDPGSRDDIDASRIVELRKLVAP